MLRKPLLLCLLTLLCLGSLAACGEAPCLGGGDHHPDRTFSNPRGRALAIPGGGPSLTQLRADLQAGDYFCGIAFLGTLSEGDPAGLPQLLQEKGYAEAYPFLADLPQAQIVTHEGGQVYCLVPRDQETSLTVQTYRSDAENGYQGEVGGHPLHRHPGTAGDPHRQCQRRDPQPPGDVGGGQTAQNSSTTLPWASVTTPSPLPATPQGL